MKQFGAAAMSAFGRKLTVRFSVAEARFLPLVQIGYAWLHPAYFKPLRDLISASRDLRPATKI